MIENKAIAVVGLGAILPDALDVPTFWQNIKNRRYSISEVPPERWKVEHYYDPDPSVPDKTYSKIGAWVKDYRFDPFKYGIAIPPKVLKVMDEAQQWAIAAARQALDDYGYPQRPLDPERVAVIFGNALGGEMHYRTTMRIYLVEYLDILAQVPEFQTLPEAVRRSLMQGMQAGVRSKISDITEDTMPGELSNIIAGRVANVFNFSGPNYVTDAACASSIAALQNAIEGLLAHQFDAVLTGGIDRGMGPEAYVKFSKIGALSPDGSRPYADGANGFVMGEGAIVYLLKRLTDAEKNGDKVYAVIRGVGGSSDGKGKGITAPNPLGQQRAIERAWKNAGVSPASAGLIEGHGTSTRVGDVTEVNSLNAVFAPFGLPAGKIALGSVKSNIGHLKSAAGAAGLLKVVLALHDHVLPPTANFERPNPNIDFAHLPFYPNTELRAWEVSPGEVRRAGVSSFGFGGTNFHVVVEEYLSGMLTENKTYPSVTIPATANAATPVATEPAVATQPSLSPASEEIKEKILALVSEKTGYPVDMLDLELDLEGDLGIDTVKQAELFAAVRGLYNIPRREDLRLSDYNTLSKVIGFVAQALETRQPAPGQAADSSPASVATAPTPSTKVESAPGNLKPFNGLLFLSGNSSAELQSKLNTVLQQTRQGILPPSRVPSAEEVRQEERLAIDFADADELIKRGEKALKALETPAAGIWSAMAAQGIFRSSGKPAKTAFLFPGQGSQYVNMLRELADAEPVVKQTFSEADEVMLPILGKPLTSYIFVDGDENTLAQAEKELRNTTITQPAMLTANVALLRVLQKYGFEPDYVIGHSLGEYAALVAAGVLSFPEALQVVSARGREMSRVSMEDNGAMLAVSAPLNEVEEVLKKIDGYAVIANINSPMQSVVGGSTSAIETALEIFTKSGFQATKIPVSHAFHTKIVAPASEPLRQVISRMNIHPPRIPIVANVTGELYPTDREQIIDLLARQIAAPVQMVKSMQTLYNAGVRIYVECGPKRVLNALATDNLKNHDDVVILGSNHPRKGALTSLNEALCGLYAAGLGGSERQQISASIQISRPAAAITTTAAPTAATEQSSSKGYAPLTGSVVISGAGLGLPGRNRNVFDDNNIMRILQGEILIEPFSEEKRNAMLEKRVTRLVKSDNGATMEWIDDIQQTVKLAGQGGKFNPEEEFGIPRERLEATDISTRLAIAAGIEALRDAGIPLVMAYRQTSKGTLLPDRWRLPEALADETGVIFASAFPGLDEMALEAERFYTYRGLQQQIDELHHMQALLPAGQSDLQNIFTARIAELEEQLSRLNYQFDRKFVFRILAMGHSQFAEHIGARGPNTHVNAACASTTHAVAIAEDWIRNGRCRRVVIVGGDDITDGSLTSWVGTGMMASGAATVEGDPRKAILPFDRRRNGMIMGMGAAALVIESEDAVRERGMKGICEILSTHIANSAFHGTRLDICHVSEVMNRLITTAEQRFGIRRDEIAPATVFVSHETYTPARGGSASAEIQALRHTFGERADQVVIANTKGFTGHTMGVGVEDVVAVKALEFGIVPPIANIQDGFEPDPDLGNLNLSRGGKYPVQYALRLGAGFGSQIAMTLTRKIECAGERVQQDQYQRWLAALAGYEKAELEVVQRTLRIRHDGPPVKTPALPTWQYGQIPTLWAMEASPFSSVNVTQDKHAPQTVTQAATPTPAAHPSAPPSPAIQPAVPSQPASEEIKGKVLALVSEKTGYPIEMLDLDLDLEGDLGIDTVKQAELFASVRGLYNIPRREDLRLADYNTLAKVIRFVEEATQPKQKEAKPQTTKEVATEMQPAPALQPVEQRDTSAGAAVKRRVAVPVLRPKLDLCVETGITLDMNSRILIIKDHGKTGDTLSRQLKAKKVQVLELTPDHHNLVEQIDAWQTEGDIHGVYFLPALDTEPNLQDMSSQDWHNALEERIYKLFQVMKSTRGNPFLVCATRMGGLLGCSPVETIAPLGGAVSGFAKSIAWERPDALVKVVDFAANTPAKTIASRLIEETLHDPGVVEVGWEDELRFTPVLQEKELPAEISLTLDENTVYFISGGTGGIIAPIVADLAQSSGGIFYLLGRSKLPSSNDPDLALLRKDRNLLRTELMQRLSSEGKRPAPAQVEHQLAYLERGAATLDAMERIQSAGAKVRYLICDVTDPASVQKAVQQVVYEEGHIDVLIHAAGMERSRKLESKPEEEFRQILSVKADGFFNLFKWLESACALPRAVVFFSSVAGRFGNSGQSDYSAANDLLNKLASALKYQYPATKWLSLDWGAWAEVGMASRGYIPEIMKRAGIDMLAPSQAAPLVRQELLHGTDSEVILAGCLGMLEAERHPDAGLNIMRANTALRAGKPIHKMLSQLTGFNLKEGIVLEAELDPQSDPLLKDHALNGIPVLPGVMGIEGFSIAARHIASVLASPKKNFEVTRLEDVRFLVPFKFYRNEPRRITWKAQMFRQADGLVAYATLESDLARRTGKIEHLCHFSGRVYMQPASQLPKAHSNPPDWNGGEMVKTEDIYRLYFHGPSFQILEGVQKSGEHVIGKMRTEPPPMIAQRRPDLLIPILVELCFQTAGLWEAGKTGILGLPSSIGHLTLYSCPPRNDAPIYAEVTPHPSAEGSLSFDARVMDAAGNLYLEIKEYRTSPLPYPIEQELLKPFQTWMGGNN